MGRPRSYSEDQVVEAAKHVFWEKGYDGAAIADLEAETGLNRSSLYLAFGTKRGLFDEALGAYLSDFCDPRLSGMEAEAAGLDDVEGFFAGLAAFFRKDPRRTRRGCLMVNTIAELASRDAAAMTASRAFRDRLRSAFTHALHGAAAEGEVGIETIPLRVHVLAAATLGVWLSVRMDPLDAAQICDALVHEIGSWRRSVP
jgi:TetR/AcrR family transcriptional regulator, transcriptional repressor for nem operon